MKKIVSLLLLLAMLCTTLATAEVTYPVKTDKTLTIWKLLDGFITEAGYTSTNETPGFIAWQEQSGIKVEIQEYNDTNALVLALQGGGALPDMIIMNPNWYNGGVMGMYEDGIIAELDDDIVAEYAPEYWTFMNQDPLYLDLVRQLDGKMYNLAGHVFEQDSVYRFWRGLFYRGDLLEAAGKEVPDTIEEFYDVLVALKNLDGVTTPLVFQGSSDLNEMLRNGDISSAFGLPRTGEYHIDGVWHYGAYEPEYQDLLRFVKKLYDEKLISVDYLTMESSVAQAMLCTGEAGAFYGNNSRLNTFLGSLEEGGSFAAGKPMLQADGGRTMYTFADFMVTMDDTTFITSESKNVELCLQFYNYLFTEQGNLMRNFGLEGVTYEMVDGEPVYTEFLLNNPDGYNMDGIARSYGLINWPGIHSDDQLRQRHPQQTQIDAYENWGNTDNSKHVITHTTVLDEYLNDYTNLWVDIELYINECRAKFINGEMDIETEFDDYIATLKKMGMDKVVEYKQKTLDAYNAR